MFSDQAHNLRLMAGQRRETEEEASVSGSKIFSGRSIVIICLSALVVILFLSFHYSNQRYVLELMSDKNEQVEERLLVLSVQMENLKTAINANIRENYVLKQEVASISGERDALLKEWAESSAQVRVFEKEIGQLHKDLDTVKTAQREMNLFLSQEISETLDALDKKTLALASRLEQADKRSAFPLSEAPLGTVAFFKEDYSFVVFSHAQGSRFREGDFVAVHRGKKRLAILKVIEVRDTVSAAVVEEMWAPIEKGDEARHL